jgi:hypothetical protein
MISFSVESGRYNAAHVMDFGKTVHMKSVIDDPSSGKAKQGYSGLGV